MNVSLKSITIMLFGLLLIAGCGERNEEKDRLAEEGERMRAASVERENTVGKTEQQQLRNEADEGNRAYYARAEAAKLAEVQKQPSDNLQYTTIFACTDAQGAGRNDSLADLLLNEYSNPNGSYAAYMGTSAISSICSSMNSPFTNITLLREKGNRKYSGQGAVLYLVKLNPNTTIGVLGRE
jgi:hypothetical protein